MRRAALAAVVAVCVAGCGATRTIVKLPPASSPRAAAPAILQPSGSCPPGRSFMGCSTPPAGLRLTLGARPSGPIFPDVSDWQGHPDWAAARPHVEGAVAKLGEGVSEDPDAAYNVAAFRRLDMMYAVYWFVRPDGCSSEGPAIERDAKALGVRLVVLDEEVAGIAGYASCLNAYVRAATGQNAVLYTAPGVWPGGSTGGLRVWMAAYGPSTPPSLDGVSPVAWQFTDGRYGFPVYIPGVGQGDVSVDLKGLLAKPKRVNVAHYERYDSRRRTFRNRAGKIVARASERNTVKTYTAHGCEAPFRRPVCVTTGYHLRLLQGRLFALHREGRPWSYGSPWNIGSRNQELIHRIASKRTVKTWAAGL